MSKYTSSMYSAAVLVLLVPSVEGAIVAVPTPAAPVEIGVRTRNGLTGAEVQVYDSNPTFTTKARLNPTGTPVWNYGYSYPFTATWDGASGLFTYSVDFNQSGLAGDVTTGAMRETVTFVFPEFVGKAFETLTLTAQGSNAPAAAMTLSNLVLNGSALSDLSSSGNAVASQSYSINTPGEAFTSVSLTGKMTMSGSGGTANRPMMQVQLRGPTDLPAPEPVPEPTPVLLTGMAGFWLLRRRR